MIVDSSVIVCIVLDEPEKPRFLTALNEAETRRMSAGSWIELSAVVVRRKLIDFEHFSRLVDPLAITLEPVTIEQARIGQEAYRRYGLGTGHPARLNFGDCFSYALSKATGEPLLFKGDDFAATDITPALLD